MLAITRKPGEGFLVGDAMVRIVEISRGKLRLAVDAPPNTLVTREELLVSGPDGTLRHPDFIRSRLA